MKDSFISLAEQGLGDDHRRVYIFLFYGGEWVCQGVGGPWSWYVHVLNVMYIWSAYPSTWKDTAMPQFSSFW